MLKSLPTLKQDEELPLEIAEAIADYTLALHQFPVCRWCGGEPTGFMSPYDFVTVCGSMFCSLCGRDTTSDVDTRIIPELIRAWRSAQHPWHEVVKAYLERIDPDLAIEGSWGTHLELAFDSYGGLPRWLIVTTTDRDHHEKRVMVSNWHFKWLACLAINQTGRRRLGVEPVFDLGSNGACLSCGAIASHHVMRNFNEVLREGDIYCGKCGEFIRFWDPN